MSESPMHDAITDPKSTDPSTGSSEAPAAAQRHQADTLRGCVERAMHNYFANLGDESVTDVYEMVLSEVEAPLLEKVLEHTGGNQTKASVVLGLNRGTLRKKLKKYDLI